MIEKSKNSGKVPNLRFPGFEEEWKKTNLGKCSESLDYGMNAAASKFDGVNRYIRITDIDAHTLKYKSESPVSPDGELDDKYLVKNNDILFTRTGASTGKAYLYDLDDGKLYFAGFLIRARIKSGFNANFIFQQTQTAFYNKWVSVMSMRSGQPGLNSKEYTSFEFFIPSKTEQDKIASFIETIDNRIATQNEIIDGYESLMKGLKERVFTQKLKFKEKSGSFYPEWRNKKLGDFLTIPLKKSPEKINPSQILTVKLHLNGVLLNERVDGLKIGATKYIIRRKGQFIYGKQNLFNGAFGIIPDEFDGFLSSGDVPSLDINTKLMNPMFLYHFLGRESYYKRFEAIASGSGSKRIHEKTLLAHKILVPSLEEQNKIALFLTKIDRRIQVENATLILLQNQKKHLLQRMFI